MASSSTQTHITPMQRFLALLKVEKREIVYLYVYAVAAGLISLALPLGIQSIIGFISGGQISVSVVVLIGLIVLALLIVGGLQVMQLWLVEYLQQRIFARTAFDFAHRIPRLQAEALNQYYPPELMNRFFDVVSLQKGLAKILLDFSTAVIQIVFGLILLSLYHPYFIFLGIILVIALVFIIWSTGSRGVETSLMESKYKYKLVAWLEEMARSLSTFKLVGHTNLPMERTDGYVSSYLKVRKEHFSVLMTQYLSFVGFKTFITGGLLVLGAVLVVQREINIGQFVASEIVIILIMTAVEKIIVKLDTVYDVLTSLDKIGHVTDLPIEEVKGIQLAELPLNGGLGIQVQKLNYTYPDMKRTVLKNINFQIKPSEHVCLAGYNNSGKSTLISLLLGLYPSYEGSIIYSGVSLRDLHIGNLRSLIGDNMSKEQVFDGTLLENITLGRDLPLQDVLWAVELVGLADFVHELSEGLQTYLVGGSQRLPASIARKIVMARSIVRRPNLLIIDDFWVGMSKKEKMNLMRTLASEQFNWTMIIVSNDQDVMELCDRTLLLQDGQLVASGSYEQLSQHDLLKELTEVTA
ncbi:ABC-type bacteriocin/lantibiotic exporter with double-glycine peptidase domain [Pontibacter ummariensis]|uniref:ABC-type bacteriocin/lantibiotic exporter, contains an N-terminal double-glycine peptidase domain n=1 Tax=Pontibacter ummariensis TaxID=1610492 RepID=A0A239HBD9_9BACT|nr:ABC transporter ATP-binding protein [Pontibacter ummariensis]PRY10664.1 ABC-type bacteriocin/lantibiotic exporter with double-glycine peptidase domain [Pontibacter ummariensis]SNS78746.1 ABC-type bacteriocin/lantibiotic exporter, contains an N-terminal double-glycine peptidase domain [Pontibacter ummariensis]